ncbi:MAG: hypothetical protein JWP44_2490 [Mucilaginibacter sp.]|nr:hypothetical protein [Mucilaginibacter sp.]
MLKASALYIVIIIALVIGLICSSLIVAAYFYKIQYQQKIRYDKLANNLSSGVNILLAGDDTAYNKGKTFSLFGGDADSISIEKTTWGLYDVGIVKAFIQKDTLYKTFSIGYVLDSTKWAALYLTDNDIPLSVSGKMLIKGNAYLPKAGITQANIDGKEYQGDKQMVIGHKYLSERTMPSLNKDRLQELLLLEQKHSGDTSLKTDSMKCSYLSAVHLFSLNKKKTVLNNVKLDGNIILISDTLLIIDSSAMLNNIIVYAKSIIVKNGFHGNCQLFASDSIHIESNCKFDYPSALGILRTNASVAGTFPQITIDSNINFKGIIFTYERNKSSIGATITIGKNVVITGQIYSQSILKFTDSSVINGSVYTNSFVYKKNYKYYPNYLIDAQINVQSLSPYYLTSDLLPVAGKRKKILQWLEAN